MALGYDRRLFILAFDHRGSTHQRNLFGIDGALTPEDHARILDAKSVVFDGFVRALGDGAPPDAAGILVDEQFGADLARKARANDWICAVAAERSGVSPFELEYGDDFAAHIEDLDPTFTKALIRYNPHGAAAANHQSLARLLRLADWLHGTDRKLLCELIVPAEPAQLASVDGDFARFDTEVRPALMRRSMADFHAAGIEPDVWKLEGVDRREDCEMIAEQARVGGRANVGCVVLGRGAATEKVEHWLRTAAGVNGYVGFAIGRSFWGEPLTGYLAGSRSREQAAALISASYRRAIEVSHGVA